MISYLRGTVVSKGAGGVVLDVNGVGYELALSANAVADLPAAGRTAQVHTYLQVKDDGMSLFGFSDPAERDLFLKLVGVSGVGPKMALAVLSTMRPVELASAIADGDVKLLSTAPGIGKKTAQRIVLELQGVLKTDAALVTARQGDAAGGAAMADAVEALEGMGFSEDEVAAALKDCDETDVSDVVRHALRNLGGSR